MFALLALVIFDAGAQPPPKITASMDKRIIRRVVAASSSDIRACYERALTSTPGIHGRYVVRWTIDKTGVVSEATVTQRPDPMSALLESCLLDVVKKMKFPEPDGGGIVIVNYPFVFRETIEPEDNTWIIVVGVIATVAVAVSIVAGTRLLLADRP